MMDGRQDLSVEELEAQEIVALPGRELLQAGIACSSAAVGYGTALVLQGVNVGSCNAVGAITITFPTNGGNGGYGY